MRLRPLRYPTHQHLSSIYEQFPSSLQRYNQLSHALCDHYFDAIQHLKESAFDDLIHQDDLNLPNLGLGCPVGSVIVNELLDRRLLPTLTRIEVAEPDDFEVARHCWF